MDQDKIHYFEKFMKVVPINIFFKDKECRYIYASQICEQLNGSGPGETIVGKTDFEVQRFPELAKQYYEDDRKIISTGEGSCYISEFPMPDKTYYYEVKKEAVRDDDNSVIGIVGIVTDVTERMEMRTRMDEFYMTDPTTGLYNKKYLEAWKKVGVVEFPVTFIVGDCNCLKKINDTYGHEYGNQLLKFVGELFRSCLSKNCTAIREGGDEFLIICNHTTEKEADQIIKLLERKATRLYVKGNPLSVAYGMATMDKDEYNYDNAHRIADQRMYRAKQQMKNDK